MKKLLSLLVICALMSSLAGCGGSKTEPTVPSTEHDQTEVIEPVQTLRNGSPRIGNMSFDVTGQMTYTQKDPETFTVDLVPGKMYCIAYALDISDDSVEFIDEAVKIQHKIMVQDNGEGFEKTQLDSEICGFHVIGESYGAVKEDGTQFAYAGFTFTDTYYVYTLQCYSSPDDEDSAYQLGKKFGDFMGTGYYHGPEPRVAVKAVEETLEGDVEGALLPAETSEPETTPPEAPSAGERNALKKAKSYLNVSAFSYNGLIGQLEYSEYTHDEAVYAAENCGADWNEQALEKAQSYLDISAFSYQGLIDQLMYVEFTEDQATYAVENCGADWNEQAAKKAASYLEISSFSRNKLISQLEYVGFTHEQAVYGVEAEYK